MRVVSPGKVHVWSMSDICVCLKVNSQAGHGGTGPQPQHWEGEAEGLKSSRKYSGTQQIQGQTELQDTLSKAYPLPTKS